MIKKVTVPTEPVPSAPIGVTLVLGAGGAETYTIDPIADGIAGLAYGDTCATSW